MAKIGDAERAFGSGGGPHSANARREPFGDEGLRAAVETANVPVLALLLVHLTGERRWIEAPYEPTRNVGLGDNPTGGLDDDRQAEIREAARAAIVGWLDGRPMALPSPPAEMLVEMLAVSMGEPVPAEYGPMIAAELGTEPIGAGAGEAAVHPHLPSGFDALIIGAGISGIAAAIALGKAGIPYRLVERGPEVGGTWLRNRYPGCSVDTPSSIYSFSFAPHEWKQDFGTRDEVLGYLQKVATEAGVLPRITFDAEVVSAEYDEGAQSWRVLLRGSDGELETRRPAVLISAVGVFSRARLPEIDGLSDFAGECVHTSGWPEEGIELAGRRVGVIGNGASAMQVVPAIVDEVAKLDVFQRSPHWIAPFPNLGKRIPAPARRLATEVPLYGRWARVRWAWTFNDRLYPALQKDPAWPHPERAVNAENDAHRRHFLRYLESETESCPELREALTPGYPPFGKRILLDNGWFRALCRDNVELVADPIVRIEGDTVHSASDGRYGLDVLICATGFDAVRFLAPIEIDGRRGQSLHEVWDDDDARAYLGSAVPGFPNFFIMYGPNIQPGHGGSLFGLAEMQAQYISDLVRQMVEAGIGAVECKRSVWSEYNERVDRAHERMVWTHPGMDTYYRNARGRVVVPGAFKVIDLWQMMQTASLDDYETERSLRPTT